MKQVKPIVHCIYTESNKSLTQLLDEYFRAYLSCSLEMTNKAMLPYLKKMKAKGRLKVLQIRNRC